VHERCLLQWLESGGRDGGRDREEVRSRCELCGTAYVFEFDRPLESVVSAERLCDTIWGNIGAHIAFQYLLTLVLLGHIKNFPFQLHDILIFQGVYHLAFLGLFAFSVSRHVQAPWRVYVRYLLTVERSVYIALYLGMWITVLWTGVDNWFTIANNISIQTYPPLIPYFHRMTLTEMNKGVRRVLLDWNEERDEEGVRRRIVRGIARGRGEEEI
jgi:hypothetical protein